MTSRRGGFRLLVAAVVAALCASTLDETALKGWIAFDHAALKGRPTFENAALKGWTPFDDAALKGWTTGQSIDLRRAHPETRALWVLRTSLTSPASIASLVEAARQHGFNTLLVQVRGR